MLLRNQKSILNVLVLLILTTFLTSCSSVKKLDVFTTEVERQPLELPSPLTPKLEDIKWTIITSENADEVFKRMEEEGIDPVIFGLSDKDFQLLAKNFAQIRAHMMKLNVMIDEYKDYYESDVINKDKELMLDYQKIKENSFNLKSIKKFYSDVIQKYRISA